jgi:hypothetical protein
MQQKSLAKQMAIPTIRVMLQRSKENREQQRQRQRGVPEQPFNYTPSQ